MGIQLVFEEDQLSASGAADGDEVGCLQRGAADQSAVDVGLGEERSMRCRA
jgi:hypothetical protein